MLMESKSDLWEAMPKTYKDNLCGTDSTIYAGLFEFSAIMKIRLSESLLHDGVQRIVLFDSTILVNFDRPQDQLPGEIVGLHYVYMANELRPYYPDTYLGYLLQPDQVRPEDPPLT
ncbi:hypothetical protein HYFRA_00011222 [Hymenoscyphus fraxineus]|uniref:Uncharacterized protein n=1 Tax=Hymenoscyphus fraxineus TaxID=746836 RepID=A0A9N9L278_9HELO|nr:hypothetical protein HYFRA_00011222 [Hymenoscyphus fraxineus]